MHFYSTLISNNIFSVLAVKSFFLIWLLLISTGNIRGQENGFEVPTTNSRGKVQQRIATTDIEVSYNRPSVKGRIIFGDLVPYNQVWRTGSDASTKITFSTPVTIAGHKIDAGSYELFTIPGEREWTLILQENHSQWGSYAYKEEFDILRTTSRSKQLPDFIETFTMNFGDITSNSASLVIAWENTSVAFDMSIDLKETVLPQLEAALEKDGKKHYFRAAMFYYENDLDINRAADLMAKAIENNPDHLGMLYRQALILERKGDMAGAIEASEHSLSLAQKVPRELKEEYTKLNMALLNRLKK